MNTLSAQLTEFREAWQTRVGGDVANLITSDIEALRATGIVGRARGEGDKLPHLTTLLDAHGKPFDLTRAAGRQALLLTFYRGGWCPYCNIELRAYQALLPEIEALGAKLVAVSLELPDHSLSTAEKNALAYPVVSDVGSKLIDALGLRFELSEAVRPFYEKSGHALPERHGDGAWSLPLPATYVIARGGHIAKAFIEPDYRQRMEPTAALAALRELLSVAA
jgi:peroxiredoxin